MRSLIISLFVCCPLLSLSDDLDKSIQKEMARENVPALTFAVVQHGKIVRLGAYGYGSLEWKANATNDTKFEVASVSKMIAGTAIRILIEQGKIGLEDPISKYLAVPAEWNAMKIRHLVTMSSGFPEDFGGPTIPYDKDVVTPDDDASLIKSFGTLKMVAPVGQRFSYSSVNYAMLGMIASKVSGMSYADFVKKNIFEPAGMSDSSVIDNTAVVPHRAEGYRKENGQIKRGRFLGQYLHSRADDAILSTTRDYARFIIALQEHKIVHDLDAYWNATTADSGKPLDYSYGWFSDTFLGHRRLEHSGGYRTGFHTYVARYPDDDVSVIAFTNCDYSAVRNYVNVVSRRYLAGVSDPEFESRKLDPNPEQTKRLTAIMDGLKAGKLDETTTDANAIEPIGLDTIKEFLGEAGPFTFAGTKSLTEPLHFHGLDLVSYETLKTSLGGDTQYVTLYLERSGKVGYIEPTN